MAVLNEYKVAINAFATEWDAAEKAVKQAELIDAVAVISSILELRYAGRRFVEALNKIAADGSQAEIEALLQDAKFDCHRARHDAIDALTSKIALDLDLMCNKLGYDAILKAYPNFITFSNKLSEIQERIAEARKARQNREAIYTSLEVNEYEDLVKEFKVLRRAEPIMKSLARRERLISWGGLTIGIIGVLAGIVIAYFD